MLRKKIPEARIFQEKKFDQHLNCHCPSNHLLLINNQLIPPRRMLELTLGVISTCCPKTRT